MEKTAIEQIELRKEEFIILSNRIWCQPEVAFQEYHTSTLIADYLEKNGFTVEREIAGLKTAVKAVWGEGSPSIGFLGELDALPGLSQKISTTKEAFCENGNGHGCGHNLVAVAHLAAVLGLKEQMKKENLPGRIVYYGCPGEEAGTGKLYMARGHAFDDIDCFIHFHPGQMNMTGISAISSCSAKFDFTGRTAHPSINPEDGRSALEGAELMNIGANYLRAHLTNHSSISYVFTDGGDVPNMIPDRASLLYDLRALRRSTVYQIYHRLQEIAEGAARMSGTKVKPLLLGCTYDLLNNSVFMKLLERCFDEIPQEEYSEKEIKFMRALNEDDREYTKKMRESLGADTEDEIHRGLEPMQMNFGSTDVGDVSYIVPGITFRTACYPLGVEGHTWKSTACSGHSIGHKGMIRAAKIMAEFTLHLLKNPQILQAAKNEFAIETEEKPYICSIDETVPLPDQL